MGRWGETQSVCVCVYVSQGVQLGGVNSCYNNWACPVGELRGLSIAWLSTRALLTGPNFVRPAVGTLCAQGSVSTVVSVPGAEVDKEAIVRGPERRPPRQHMIEKDGVSPKSEP